MDGDKTSSFYKGELGEYHETRGGGWTTEHLMQGLWGAKCSEGALLCRRGCLPSQRSCSTCDLGMEATTVPATCVFLSKRCLETWDFLEASLY